MVIVVISYLKSYRDEKSFNYAKRMGFPVYEIKDLETVDNKIKELKENNYTTIIITSELAGFSEDIIKKYKKQKNFNIIITW